MTLFFYKIHHASHDDKATNSGDLDDLIFGDEEWYTSER